MTKSHLKKRGEQLVKLAYRLENLSAEARQANLVAAQGGLRAAMESVRAVGNEYLDLADAA